MSYISSELRSEIERAIRERLSVEVILEDAKFVGTPESIEELVNILIDVIGPRMTLEFLFSSQVAVWEEYRKMLHVDAWDRIIAGANFTSANFLLLGESLIQRDEIDEGSNYLVAAVNAATLPVELVNIAEVVKHEIDDAIWVSDILDKAESAASTSEHYSQVAEATVKIAEDESEGRILFESAVKLAQKSSDFSDASLAILKSLKDVTWSKEIFAKMKDAPQSGTPLEMLAEEEFNEELSRIEG
jgi:hypothetical protein